jgi:hypothetical protein
MLADRFGLQLSTSSTAARDAYVDASERALTFYPGALAAYDSAIAADPRFALAHAGKAQVLMREGNVAGARTGGFDFFAVFGLLLCSPTAYLRPLADLAPSRGPSNAVPRVPATASLR